MSQPMPELAAALGGGALPGGGADYGGGMDAGGPPPSDDTAQGGEQYATSLDALQAAEDALQAFIAMDPDHADRAVAAQCLQNVLKLQASNQDSAQTGNLSSLQRALQQGPSAGGAGY